LFCEQSGQTDGTTQNKSKDLILGTGSGQSSSDRDKFEKSLVVNKEFLYEKQASKKMKMVNQKKFPGFGLQIK
jgi:hypothetical protein